MCQLCAPEALAEPAATPLRVLDGWLEQEYQRAYPDRAVEHIRDTYDDNGDSDRRELLLSGDWDVASVNTYEVSLAELDAAGLLMDLSAETQITQRFGELLPVIREAVTRDDRTVALPGLMFGMVMQIQYVDTVRAFVNEPEVDVRGQLGLTEADAPRTFRELCDLAERYMALPKETRKGTVFNVEAAVSNARQYFLYYLLELYASEACVADGDVQYDTPVFRDALADLDRLTAALKQDKKITYGAGPGVYGVVADASNGLIGENLLYLTAGASDRLPARLTVFVVNPNTQHKAEALDYLALAAERFAPQFAPMLYQSPDLRELARIGLEQDLVSQAQQNESQELLDSIEAKLESGEYEYDFYRPEDIERYRAEAAPRLSFPCYRLPDVYKLSEQYARGKLTADEFIERLNAAVN